MLLLAVFLQTMPVLRAQIVEVVQDSGQHGCHGMVPLFFYVRILSGALGSTQGAFTHLIFLFAKYLTDYQIRMF